MDEMLAGGAAWALGEGYGEARDLECIEDHGRAEEALPEHVSERARKRQTNEMGTLGSGNHYLEVQEVREVLDNQAARAFGLVQGECVVTIHCGSRGLGHQIGTDYLRRMVIAARDFGIELPERELACAPIDSPVGQDYLGAMRAGINCALANRQVITHLARQAFARIFPGSHLAVLFDVSHNTCKVEEHVVGGRKRTLYVHRKGATRSVGPHHPSLPAELAAAGQPVLIGGSMGTASYVLAGDATSEEASFSSSCHGAGRAMSRNQALRQWRGREVVDDLARRGVLVRSPSMRGVAEEAPGAYKDVSEVVDSSERAGLARKVARLTPMVCIKG
jgi:tRNA-splicing ligase RtcB